MTEKPNYEVDEAIVSIDPTAIAAPQLTKSSTEVTDGIKRPRR